MWFIKPIQKDLTRFFAKFGVNDGGCWVWTASR